ncbi:MAG: MarR family transcriptional regulator [Lachnospiraceae bacterium]|nr:MarR family transcriptional regulator [Lachnospiraceae bacterium]
MGSRERFEEFYRLNKGFSAFYGALAGLLDLSGSEFAVFYTIKAYGEGCAQKDVCEYCMISKQTVSSGIEGMVRKKLVTLKPGKGRLQEIYLTAKGRKIMDEKLSLVENAENKAYGKLSKTEQEQLNDLMEKFLNALHGN